MFLGTRSARAAVAFVALATLPALAPSGPAAAADVSYNVTLRSNVDDYAGVNDIWGYEAPGGTKLAIYGHQTGTSFVDATDPDNPVEVFNLPGPTSTWRDIKTYQNWAYIVTEGSGAGTGLQIVDLTDPLAPVHASTYVANQFTTAHNIWIDEAAGVAYGCGASPGGGMHILSLADPVNPVEIDYFADYYIHDLYVGNGRAYAGAIYAGALAILDVANPASPFTLGFHTYPDGFTHNAWPTADGTHCISTDEVVNGHLMVWDITNPASLSLASEYEVTYESAIIHNTLIDADDVAWISYYAAGTHIVDLGDPTRPVEIGWYDTSTRTGGFDGCWGIYPFRGDDVYYASDRQNGLFILEFTGGLAGDLAGTVRDAVTSAPVADASVSFVGLDLFDFATDAAGDYTGRLAGGTYDVVVTRFGYESDTTTVVVPERGLAVHDVDLVPRASGALRLEVVRAGSAAPLEGAVVEMLDTPLPALATDAAGAVEFPAVPAGDPFLARVGRFGTLVAEVPVTATAGQVTVVPVTMEPGFLDDFETDQAWTMGAPDDDATDGLFVRGIPTGSYYLGLVEPDADFSPTGDGYCLITEPHDGSGYVGTSDVDNGKTSVLSPVFDGTGFDALVLSYRRWFSNRAPEPGDDEFRADVSTDGGSTWTNLETVTVGAETWADVVVDLQALVTPTATMQLRFVAEDLGPNQFVEAGVDEIAISTGATDAPGLAGPAVPAALALASPRPNPSREGTALEFRLPEAGPVRLEVFDVAGRRVATLLAAERLPAGVHRAAWDGRADDGAVVPPGVYFARLAAGDRVRSVKVARVR